MADGKLGRWWELETGTHTHTHTDTHTHAHTQAGARDRDTHTHSRRERETRDQLTVSTDQITDICAKWSHIKAVFRAIINRHAFGGFAVFCLEPNGGMCHVTRPLGAS